MTTICDLFGPRYANRQTRIESYDYFRSFMELNHDFSLESAPDTDVLGPRLAGELLAMDEKDLAFLLCHSGFLPEDFEPDSREETLYSKLIEILVSVWAKKIGFDETTIHKQKSSKEDVTIADNGHVIVCDAKSFRLGRSQKAPNVKDALKEGDIAKWLKAHASGKKKPLGGLVTFPSQHDWSGGSDFYSYLTKGAAPIACLFYEHLAFLIFGGYDKQALIDLFVSYPTLFNLAVVRKSDTKVAYWTPVKEHLFGKRLKEFERFHEVAQKIIGEKIYHTMRSVEQHLSKIRAEVEQLIPADTSAAELRAQLVETLTERKTFVVARQLANIHSFRATILDYHDDSIVGIPKASRA